MEEILYSNVISYYVSSDMMILTFISVGKHVYDCKKLIFRHIYGSNKSFSEFRKIKILSADIPVYGVPNLYYKQYIIVHRLNTKKMTLILSLYPKIGQRRITKCRQTYFVAAYRLNHKSRIEQKV